MIDAAVGGNRIRVWGLIVKRIWLPAAFLAVLLSVQSFVTASEALRTYFQAGVVFFVAVLAVRLVESLVRAWYAGRRKPYPIPDVLRGLILGVLYLLVLFYVLRNILRVDLTAYLAGSAVLTMVLGLAFQGVLSNIFSGMSLHFTRSFSRGDWVSIGPNEGIVVDTNWRETRLLDRQSNIVVLPNNVVASERITNFSQPDAKAALLIPFKLSYDAPAADVLRLLVDAARECPDVIAAPRPLAYIRSYDELGVFYHLKFWVTDFGRKDPIITDVSRLAWYKLRRHGIEIAVSLADRLKRITLSAAPAAAGDGEIAFRDLLHSSFLRRHGEPAGEPIVPEDEIRALSAAAKRSAFTKGEVLFRQGDPGSSAFVVAKGLVRGQIAYEEGGRTYVSEFEIGPGGIFGEMSLFTGLPRTATGIVVEESELLEIRGEEFGVFLERNPALAEEIAETVSARNAKNREFLSKIKELSAQDLLSVTSKAGVLERLRRFVRKLAG